MSLSSYDVFDCSSEDLTKKLVALLRIPFSDIFVDYLGFYNPQLFKLIFGHFYKRS